MATGSEMVRVHVLTADELVSLQGKWVALDRTDFSVVAHAATQQEVALAAERKGYAASAYVLDYIDDVDASQLP
jgi:hypothetical protein